VKANHDIEKSRWWILKRLKQNSLIEKSESFIYDTAEGKPTYDKAHQQKLLTKLNKDNLITWAPLPTLIDEYAVQTGQQDYGDTRTYRISLVQPAFDSTYEKYEQRFGYETVASESDEVRYRAGVISQGSKSHIFREPALAALTSVLWPDRATMSTDGKLANEGKPKPMRVFLNQLSNTKPNMSADRVVSLCKSFNMAMKRKGIGAKILLKDGPLLCVYKK
jgi:hypothetical protein